jgi:hypothetical protein
MTMPARWFSIMFAAAAALPSAVTAQSEAHRYVHLVTACSDGLKELPENLYPAWLAINSAAEVLVDFKVDGGKIKDVTMSGGHGPYINRVRRAVKTLKCRSTGAESYSVRFRIKFQYPDDLPTGAAAMQFFDEAPLPLAVRDSH